MDYLLFIGTEFDEINFLQAVEYNNMIVVKYLVEHNCPYDDDVLVYSIKYGYLDLFKYLYNIIKPRNMKSLMETAIENDQFESFLYLHKKFKIPLNYNLQNYINLHGDFKIIEYLLRFHRLNEDLINKAIEQESLKFIEFLIDKNITWNRNFTSKAVYYERLDILIILFQQGYNLTQQCLKTAIEYDYVKILDWLILNGCPQFNNMINYAKSCGSKKCIEYLT